MAHKRIIYTMTADSRPYTSFKLESIMTRRKYAVHGGGG